MSKRPDRCHRGGVILSEPLIALLRSPYEYPIVDVLAPPWCAPVYARVRGIGRVIESPFGPVASISRRKRSQPGRQWLHARIGASQFVEVRLDSLDGPNSASHRLYRRSPLGL
jgi:hypothetical protein